MKIKTIVLITVLSAITAGCTTSSMSKRDLADYTAGLTYVTEPASLFGTSEDVKIHYLEAGDASLPPMILIHGFSSLAYTWQEDLPPLSQKYHVFALDMPGFGFSSKLPDFPYGIPNYSKAVLNFMEQKGIDKTIIGGNSMGGAISLWLAINNPEKITRLILVDAAAYNTDKRPGLVSLAQKQWLRPIAKPFFGKWILRMGLKQVYYDDSKVTPALVEEYGRPYKMRNGKNVPFWLFRNTPEGKNMFVDVDKIKDIKIPTLIIWGENDQWIPLDNAYKFKNDIAGSELVVIPKCGHVPQEEKPEVVVKAILDFLAKNP